MNFKTIKNSTLALGFLLLFTVSPALADTRPVSGNLSTVQAADFIKRNANNAEFVILDVRTPAEYRQGHIEKSILVDISAPSFIEHIRELDRNKVYLVYCRSGNRSRQAADIMMQLGFQNVFNMTGGFNEWISNGFKAAFPR